MTYLRLLWVYLRVGVLNELQYRANFFMQVFQSVLSLTVALGGLAIVFSHTDNLGGWRPDELLALVGVYTLVGGIIGFLIEPSMQRLMEDVRQGTLDFTLINNSEHVQDLRIAARYRHCTCACRWRCRRWRRRSCGAIRTRHVSRRRRRRVVCSVTSTTRCCDHERRTRRC